MTLEQGSIDELLNELETKSEEPAPLPSKEPVAPSAKAAPSSKDSDFSNLLNADNRGRGEISAASLGRMMGLATTMEMKVLEQKVDLLTTKLNGMSLKVDKLLSALNNLPSGGDMERIDIQLGTLKNLLKQLMAEFPNKESE